jgi:hypothetical protein
MKKRLTVLFLAIALTFAFAGSVFADPAIPIIFSTSTTGNH